MGARERRTWVAHFSGMQRVAEHQTSSAWTAMKASGLRHPHAAADFYRPGHRRIGALPAYST